MKKSSIFFLFILTCFSSGTYAETRALDLQKNMEQAINSGRKSQKQAEQWAVEQAEILNKIREQKNMKRWLAHQKKKYEIYIEKQKQTIDDLKSRKKEVEKIKINLEPFLDEIVVCIEDFIKNDMPFLYEERNKRLAFLKDSLNDYHLDLAEKTKQVFDTLQIEAAYGKNIEKTEQSIEINNIPVQVEIFRLGRTALFYLTPDKKKAGWFNRKTGQWEELPGRYTRDIKRAVEIAEKKRSPMLLNLPVGKVE